jgi:tetratricopeptide (TPR) repeat protein
VIERLLEAERALAVGLLDQAERLYGQAADADPRNAIAVVGLARVALERGDEERALELGGRALAIDPENVAGRRLVDRLSEVRRHRGLGGYVAPSAPPAVSSGGPAPSSDAEAAPDAPRPGRLRRWLRRR